MLTTKINVERERRAIAETLDTARRREKAHRARELGTAELETMRTQHAAAESRVVELQGHPGNATTVALQRSWLLKLSVLLIIVDIPIQFAVNSAFMSAVAWIVWAISAPFLALGFAGVSHGVVLAFATDQDRPARSIRISRAIAWMGFLVAILAAGVLLLARIAGPDLAAQLETFATVSLYGAAEGFPLAAGGFSAWWHLLSQPQLEAKRRDRLHGRIRELEDFLQWLEDEDGEEQSAVEGPSQESPRIGGPSGSAPKGPPVAGLTVLLTLGLAGSQPLVAQSSHAAPSEQRLCGIFLDVSQSVDSSEYSTAIQSLAGQLGNFVNAFGCEVLVIGHFSDEGAFAQRRAFPVPESVPVTCGDTGTPTTGARRLLANFNGFRTHLEETATAACRTEQEDATARFLRAWRDFVGAASGYLENTSPLQHETHTTLVALVRHLLERSSYRALAVVTDLIETIEKPIPSFTVPSDTRLFFIAVPAGPRYGGLRATRDAIENWRRAVQAARILPYPELSVPDPWRMP